MTQFTGQDLHKDDKGVKTSRLWGALGDGTNDWFGWTKIADGGNTTQGLKADAAVTDPALSGSIVALLKGLLTGLRLGPAGILKAEDAVAVNGDAGVVALAVRKDASASNVSTDGDYSTLETDVVGALKVTGIRPTNATSSALESSRIVKAAPGMLYGYTGVNTNAATRYIQIFDSATLPADGVKPIWSQEVATATSFSWDGGFRGRFFSNGIVICNSSTIAAKTLGAADSMFDVQYL